jgi:Probable sensor domain DACNV
VPPSASAPCYDSDVSTPFSTTGPAYPAARIAAPRVHAHFSRHLELAREQHPARVLGAPDIDSIEAVIEAAFWASLRRQEGYVPRISIVLLPSEAAGQPLLFERPLPLSPTALARVAPAVERPGIHLGVWRSGRDLCVWGTTRNIPDISIVIEVGSPGLIVVKHHRGDARSKFVNVAVLEGDQVKIVDERASTLPDCPELLRWLLGFDSPASWTGDVNVLVELAVSMRAHGRGGLMLVVPADSDDWQESIVRPIPYAINPPFSELADVIRSRPADAAEMGRWHERLDRAVDAVGGLTAIDGATLINDRFDVLAFGAKIVRRRSYPTIEQVMLTEPVEGSVAAVVSPSLLGGTRHSSAAQFVRDQRKGLALVASQDGGFTIFAWSPCDDIVYAHRVETLLM